LEGKNHHGLSLFYSKHNINCGIRISEHLVLENRTPTRLRYYLARFEIRVFDEEPTKTQPLLWVCFCIPSALLALRLLNPRANAARGDCTPTLFRRAGKAKVDEGSSLGFSWGRRRAKILIGYPESNEFFFTRNDLAIVLTPGPVLLRDWTPGPSCDGEGGAD
jgi:hypothetical protein